MPSTINATSTGSGGLISTGDASGQLELQTNSSTRLTINSSGNATFAGNLTVNGTLSATSGLPSLATPLAVVGNATAGSEIRLPEDTDNGSNYVALKAADNLASNVTFTLPSADGTSGQVLQTNGSGTLSFATPASGFSAMQIFTSSGTFTIPAGKTTVKVTVVGAGGGGGASSASSTPGAGGGGGGTGISYLTSLTPGNTISVTIGSGGAGGTSGGNGSNGGSSSIQSGTQTITTITANGGTGGGGANSTPSAGSGGTTSGANINIKGGGGGGATSFGSPPGALGGNSSLGAGAAGIYGNSPGQTGGDYGGGGGGAPSPGIGRDGGAGAGGVVIFEY